jgi:hypothetical protein
MLQIPTAAPRGCIDRDPLQAVHCLCSGEHEASRIPWHRWHKLPLISAHMYFEIMNRFQAFPFPGLSEILSSYCSWWPPLLSTGQSSWLQIRRSRVQFPGTARKRVVGLERSPLSLVSTTEELLERNSSGSGLEIREYGRRDSSRLPCGSLYPQKSWH